MRIKTLIGAILLPAILIAQPYQFKIKREAIPLTTTFLAGLAEGVQDYLAFHNSGTSHFWGMDSWKNKYRDGDPAKGETFRGKYLTFTTDGFHLMKFTKNLFQTATIVLKFNEKKKWYYYLIDGVIYWGVNRAGFNLTYNFIK